MTYPDNSRQLFYLPDPRPHHHFQRNPRPMMHYLANPTALRANQPAPGEWVYTMDGLPMDEDEVDGLIYAHSPTYGVVGVEARFVRESQQSYPAWTRKHPKPAPPPPRTAWRPATAADIAKGPVPARFRDAHGDAWREGLLHGFRHDEDMRFCAQWSHRRAEWMEYCEVRE